MADATEDDLEQALLNDATQGISSAAVDGMSVTKSSLQDRIRVADRAKGVEAGKRNHRGLRFTAMIPHGAGGSP